MEKMVRILGISLCIIMLILQIKDKIRHKDTKQYMHVLFGIVGIVFLSYSGYRIIML